MFKLPKINSIGFGPQGVALIAVLTLAIPALFYLCYSLLGFFGVNLAIILSAASASFMLGMVLLALFLLGLGVEFVQDRSRDRQYERARNAKIKIAEGTYECQACGNRLVGAADKTCAICGQRLG